MVMIARDERENVRPCFESFWDHVDEVVLCDTGSRDGTIGEARRFAKERGEPKKLIVGRFKWRDDFGAARSHAHSLATGDAHIWIDLDERIVGGEEMRAVATKLLGSRGAGVTLALVGSPGWTAWRPNFLRAPVRWDYPVNEMPVVRGDRMRYTDRVRWHHTRTGARTRRDLDIALRWAAAEPNSWLPLLAAAGTAVCSEPVTAIEYCDRALALPDLTPKRRADFCLLRARASYETGAPAEADKWARLAVRYGAPGVMTLEAVRSGAKHGDPDADGTVYGAWQLRARCALDRGDHSAALEHAVESSNYAFMEGRRKATLELVEEIKWAHAAKRRSQVLSSPTLSMALLAR